MLSCQSLCQSHTDCTHFTHYGPSGAIPNTCYLFTECPTRNDHCHDCHSGPKHCMADYKSCPPIGADFGGTWFCFPELYSTNAPVKHGARCINFIETRRVARFDFSPSCRFLQVHFSMSRAHDVPRVPRRALESTAGREALHLPSGNAGAEAGAERNRQAEERAQGREDFVLAAAGHKGTTNVKAFTV